MAGVNYTALLRNDPALQALLAQVNAQGVQGRVGLTGSQQQVLGRLGETINPSSLPAAIAARLGNLGAALTPELQGIVNAGNQAGTSTLAQLNRQYHQGLSAQTGNLAARGLLHSGAYRQHANDALHDLTVNQYTARQGALDQLSGLQQGYLTQQQNLAGQAAQGTSDALGRITGQITAGQIASPAAAPSPPRPAATGYMAREGSPPPKPAAPHTFGRQVARNSY